MQSFSELNLNSLHISLWGQACFGVIEAGFGHFDTRLIAKADLNNFMTFSETASDDLKMASEVKSNFLLSKEGWDHEIYIALSHSSSKDIILGLKNVKSLPWLNLQKSP
jgi:hypothetical protein